MILTDKAIKIIEKYKNQGQFNYVFPVFKKEKTLSSMLRRAKWMNLSLNKTLEKVCAELGIPKITWGAARSSFISRMLDHGYTPTQVAEPTGNLPQRYINIIMPSRILKRFEQK
ncbi:MAG: hypothetical protein LIO65_01825 [Odoribacter sp.]|nr:hypothetical protein [Odoribacter sp.]